ncbi:hypothetical protein [Desertivirga arenae]|uniref:hypothetical protein n=1 Tax=Desertivirga arenae TaxID=2810309 RepID=UPI001A96143A|nr:hypothetical protein [Pedobacter sp. SYSU D00823]
MLNPTNKTTFFKLLNRDLSLSEFETWIYKHEAILESELPAEQYFTLISFNYNQRDARAELQTVIESYINTEEFNIWRTKELLSRIVNEQIDLVLATRRLRAPYYEMAEKYLPEKLAIGYESVLDDIPIPEEYHQWDPVALKMKLKVVESYKEDLLKDARETYDFLSGKEH